MKDWPVALLVREIELSFLYIALAEWIKTAPLNADGKEEIRDLMLRIDALVPEGAS